MSKQSFLTALGAGLLLFAIALAQAAELTTHRHAVAAEAGRHPSAAMLRHSDAQAPGEDETTLVPVMSSPNVGWPPAQPRP